MTIELGPRRRIFPPDVWGAISRALDSALELPESERDSFLRREYRDNPELLAILLPILAGSNAPDALLDRPAWTGFPQLLEDGDSLPFQVPVVLANQFRLDREIGRGGMGIVFLGHDLKHDRQVAVKVLPRAASAAGGTARFLSEIRTTARLRHPSIVPLFDSGEISDSAFFVMPYVAGESLRARLDRTGPLPVADAVRVASTIAAALAYAHAQGVIHRDVKPSNVLLSGDQTLLADFGIARASSVTSDDLTASGVVLGSPVYMSPEQAGAAPNVDARADIYAFGVLAYELFVGRPPFTGREARTLLAAHLSESPEPIETLRPSLPPSLAALIMRCLAKDPADRPQRASEIVHALDAIRTPNGGSPPSVGLTTRWPRRALVWTVASAFAVLAAAGVLIARARLADGVDGTVMLAVLPFENQGPATDDYFSDGLAEAISNRLASVPALGVIAPRSASAYKRSTKSLTQIGRELGVQYVLRATVRSHIGANGDSTAQVSPSLVRVSDGRIRWAPAPYPITLGDAFAVQNEIAERVASELGVTFSHSNAASTAEAPTSSPAAYEAYLRGVELESQFYKFVEPALAAIAAKRFAAAVHLDTTFGLAQAKLGLVQAFEAFDGDSSQMARAKESVERALELSPNLADSYLAKGVLLSFAYPDPPGAIAALEQARQLRPGDARILGFLGDAKALSGDSAGLPMLKRSVELDPRSAPALVMAAGDFAMFRQYREAARYLDEWKRLADDPADFALYAAHFAIAAHGDTASAVRLWDAAARITPKPTIQLFAAYQELTQGIPRVARLTLDSMAFRSSHDTLNYYIGKGIAALRLTQAKIAEAYGDSVRAFVRTFHSVPTLDGVEETHGALIAAAWFSGRTDEFAREVDSTIAELTAYGERNQVLAQFTCYIAQDYANMRDVEKAISYGRRCLTLPGGWTSWNLRLLPEWQGILKDPKVQAFLHQFPVQGGS